MCIHPYNRLLIVWFFYGSWGIVSFIIFSLGRGWGVVIIRECFGLRGVFEVIVVLVRRFRDARLCLRSVWYELLIMNFGVGFLFRLMKTPSLIEF